WLPISICRILPNSSSHWMDDHHHWIRKIHNWPRIRGCFHHSYWYFPGPFSTNSEIVKLIPLRSPGLYAGFPGNIAWISNNVHGGYKRSVALAIHVGFGNLAGIFTANWYRSRDAPQYILGHSLSLFIVVLGFIAALTLRIGYQWENNRRN